MSLINAHSLDPARLYDAQELTRACERYQVDTQRGESEEDIVYQDRLLKVRFSRQDGRLALKPLGRRVEVGEIREAAYDQESPGFDLREWRRGSCPRRSRHSVEMLFSEG